MHRFFIPSSVRAGNAIIVTGAQAHQISRVLRLRAGEDITLVPVDTEQPVEWRVRLETVDARAVSGIVVAQRPGLPEPECVVTLVPALLKGERFDWLLQKATELGASAIQPIITQRTVRKVSGADRAAVERWQRIVTEAAEQSGRSRIPRLYTPVALGEWRGGEYHVVLVAHEGVTTRSVIDALARETPSVAILIGPEGGFTEDEVAQCEASGAVPVSLGPRVLRAETAAIAALTLTRAATRGLEPPQPRAWTLLDDTA